MSTCDHYFNPTYLTKLINFVSIRETKYQFGLFLLFVGPVSLCAPYSQDLIVAFSAPPLQASFFLFKGDL